MKWKKREREIRELRKRTPKYRCPLPNLKVEQRLGVAPLSNGFCAFGGKREFPSDAQVFPVGTLHKQGMMMLTPDMVRREMQFIGGRKV